MIRELTFGNLHIMFIWSVCIQLLIISQTCWCIWGERNQGKQTFVKKQYERFVSESVEMVCNFYRGFDGFYYESLHNQRIVSGGRIVIKNASKRASINITDVQEKDDGKYLCKLSKSKWWQVAFASTNLTVIKATINLQSPTTVQNGMSFLIPVVFSKKPTSRIAWVFRARGKDYLVPLVKGSVGQETTSGSCRLLSNGSLLISNVTETGEGFYCLETERPTILKCVFLEIKDKPKLIHNLPAPFNVLKGSKFQLNCNVTDVDVVTWKYGTRVKQTTALLTIEKAEKSLEGEFLCTAKNRFGEGRWRTSLNYVIDKGNLTYRNKRSAELGTRITLSCSSTGSPAPTWSWVRIINDQPSVLLRKTTQEKNTMYIINNVKKSDTGKYKCVANFSVVLGGNVEESVGTIDVIVFEKPKLMKPLPGPFIVRKGAKFQLECIVSNADSVVWKYGMTTTQNGVLVIKKAEKNLEGEFVCIANNKFRQARWNTSLQYVVDKGILSHNKQKRAGLKTDTALTCSSTGKPPPIWSWLKSVNNQSIVLVKETTRATATKFKIRNVKKSDSGNYTCVADFGTLLGGAVEKSSGTVDVVVYESCLRSKTTCPQGSKCYNLGNSIYCRCKPGYVMVNKECLTGNIYKVSNMFLNVTWHHKYADSESEAFLRKTIQYEPRIQRECKQDGCLGVRIDHMRQGSVIFSFSVVYNSSFEVPLDTIQHFLKRLQNTNVDIVPPKERSSSVVKSSICIANGEMCGKNAFCSVAKEKSQFLCKCLDGFVENVNGVCSTKESSSGSVAIIAAVSAFVIVVAVVSVFLYVKRKCDHSKETENTMRSFNNISNASSYEMIQAANKGNEYENGAYEPVPDAQGLETSKVVKPSHDHTYESSVHFRTECKAGYSGAIYTAYNSNLSMKRDTESEMYEKLQTLPAGPTNTTLKSNTNENTGADQTTDIYMQYDNSASQQRHYAANMCPNFEGVSPEMSPSGECEPIYELYGSADKAQSEPVYAIYEPPTGDAIVEEHIYSEYGCSN